MAKDERNGTQIVRFAGMHPKERHAARMLDLGGLLLTLSTCASLSCWNSGSIIPGKISPVCARSSGFTYTRKWICRANREETATEVCLSSRSSSKYKCLCSAIADGQRRSRATIPPLSARNGFKRYLVDSRPAVEINKPLLRLGGQVPIQSMHLREL